MESFLIYILKASALLGIFYLSYLLLLKKETSFQLNRKFLLAGLFTSLILPLIHLTKKVYIEATPAAFNYLPASVNVAELPAETSLDWWQISGIIYLLISGFFLIRLCVQISAVIKIILINKIQKASGLKYIEVTENQLPFSFFNYIVFNPYKHSEKDLKLILEHEKVHAQQLHSADIILVNLIRCFLWFNPFSWLYKKAVEQNLEFIADRETVNTTAKIKEYQHALVKVSIADLRPALTNHFYQSFIKKRILMLNKKSSTQSPAWKLSLVMPLILAFMLLFNVKTEAQVMEKQETKTSEKKEVPEPEEEVEIEIEEEVEQAEAPEEIEVEIQEAPEIYRTTAKTRLTKQKSTKNIGIDPLYVLNGKKYKASKLKNKYISLGYNFEILIGDKATNTYGKDAKNGAIIIPDAKVIKNFDKEMNEIKARDNFNGKYIMVGENGKPNFLNLNSGTSPAPGRPVFFASKESSPHKIGFGKTANVKIRNSSNAPNSEDIYVIKGTGNIPDEDVAYEFRTEGTKAISISSDKKSSSKASKGSRFKVLTQDKEPLYVIDGIKQTGDFEAGTLDPENIASIMVLKGVNATKKYGKRGTNGVIEIQTKKEANGLSDSIFLISSSLNNDQIEKLKDDVLKKTGYILDLKNIKRNEEGQITKIEVKFHNSNSMVQSNYNNEDGIPNIQVGLRKGGGLIISASE